MSIEFSPAYDSGRCSLVTLREDRADVASADTEKTRVARPPSARRVAANRRNAQRSTGPRTTAGKERVSRNALKHGLCSTAACLAGECPATYATFVREIEEELQPRTTLQRSLVPHIANLMWRINRMPQAQVHIFERELAKCAVDEDGHETGEEIGAADVIARRFSDAPTSNGFLLLGRYERGLQNQLLRLMSRYDWLKKHRPTPPVDEDAIYMERWRKRQESYDYAEECARRINAETALEQACQEARAEARRAKQTQSNPPPIAPAAPEPAKCATPDAAPLTKRTQGGGEDDKVTR